MTIDAVALSLSTLPSPLNTVTNTSILTATATCTAATVATATTRVVFTLRFSPLGGGFSAQKDVIKRTVVTSADSTGVYHTTFSPVTDFATPGIYDVIAQAEDDSAGLVANRVTTISSEFTVINLNQANAQNNSLNDVELGYVRNPNVAVWKSATFTGAQLKAQLTTEGATMSGLTGTITLGTLPAGAVLTSGLVNVTALSGPTTLTATMGAESSTFAELLGATSLESTAETGVSASFVPNLAGGTVLKSKITTTVDALSTIAASGSVTFVYAYVVPLVTTPPFA